jgi:hypothetical protein
MRSVVERREAADGGQFLIDFLGGAAGRSRAETKGQEFSGSSPHDPRRRAMSPAASTAARNCRH